jgi:acyl-homoserine lactone acylase PvdQ
MTTLKTVEAMPDDRDSLQEAFAELQQSLSNMKIEIIKAIASLMVPIFRVILHAIRWFQGY